MMNLSETKRHMDRAALLKFWEVLDRFVFVNYHCIVLDVGILYLNELCVQYT